MQQNLTHLGICYFPKSINGCWLGSEEARLKQDARALGHGLTPWALVLASDQILQLKILFKTFWIVLQHRFMFAKAQFFTRAYTISLAVLVYAESLLKKLPHLHEGQDFVLFKGYLRYFVIVEFEIQFGSTAHIHSTRSVTAMERLLAGLHN